jgi:hypothetical protein
MAIVAGVDHVIYVFLPSLPFVLDGSLDCSGKARAGCHPSSRVPDRSTKIGRLLAARRLSFSAWFARRRVEVVRCVRDAAAWSSPSGTEARFGRRELDRCGRLLTLSDLVAGLLVLPPAYYASGLLQNHLHFLIFRNCTSMNHLVCYCGY